MLAAHFVQLGRIDRHIPLLGPLLNRRKQRYYSVRVARWFITLLEDRRHVIKWGFDCRLLDQGSLLCYLLQFFHRLEKDDNNCYVIVVSILVKRLADQIFSNIPWHSVDIVFFVDWAARQVLLKSWDRSPNWIGDFLIAHRFEQAGWSHHDEVVNRPLDLEAFDFNGSAYYFWSFIAHYSDASRNSQVRWLNK